MKWNNNKEHQCVLLSLVMMRKNKTSAFIQEPMMTRKMMMKATVLKIVAKIAGKNALLIFDKETRDAQRHSAIVRSFFFMMTMVMIVVHHTKKTCIRANRKLLSWINVSLFLHVVDSIFDYHVLALS